VTIDQDVIV